MSYNASAKLKPWLIAAIDVIKYLDNLEDQTFTNWIYHNSGSPNSCHICIEKEGMIYHLEDPSDLLTLYPYGVFVAEDTFAANIHIHCACYLTAETSL
jgi:hypothetical protein